MRVLIFLSLLVISSCLTPPETNSSTTVSTTTVESSTDTDIINDKNDDMKSDDLDSSASKEDNDDKQEESSSESSKNKRTIERTLGYGFNDIAGSSRLHRQSDHPSQGKFRNYFSQPSVQQAHPYQHVRYYSTFRTSGTPQQDISNRQQQIEQGHRPYNSIAASSAPSPSSASSQGASSFTSHSSLQNFGANNHIDSNTPESAYYTKPSYQQVSSYRGSPAVANSSPGNGVPIFSTSGSSQAGPLFSGPPPHAPAFFAGHSLASSHNPFATTTTHNVPNPFLAAGNFHGGPLLYQHPGSSGLAFLQNPSGHFGGPQILPVLILRVNNDGSSNNVFQHQGGISPAFLHAGLQSLLYPFQQYQAPQQVVFTPSDATQTQHTPQILYQEGPGDNIKSHYVQPTPLTANQPSEQKFSYSSVQQKKPLVPTPAPVLPTQPQKLRKNVIVVGETGSSNDGGYSQYKYGFKDKV